MRVKFYKNLPGARRTFISYMAHLAWAICVLLYQWFFLLIHRLCRGDREIKYEAVLCMIFRNEARFLAEWIEYHLLIGIDHIYLYNNFSDDDYIDVLTPYIESGMVTLIEWPYKFGQMAAYRDCYERCRDSVRWIGYIDADEFVNLQKHNDVKSMLRRYRFFPSLLMNWRDFGTAGHIKASDALITEEFTAAWPWLCHMGKCFINTDFEFSHLLIHEHWAKYLGVRLYPVCDNMLPAPHGTLLWDWGVGKVAYVNHYFSKSYEWYRYKDYQRGDAVNEENIRLRTAEGRFELHELNNYVHDYSIQRWLTLLKLRLNRD